MKYIAFITSSKIVKDISTEPFKNLSVLKTQAEVEEIPSGKYDYLVADNIQEHTRVIREAYTEEVTEFNENGEEITTLVEHEQETETYFTCDLVPKSREYTSKQIEALKQKKYHDLSKKYIREIYNEGDEFKILRRYAANPDNSEYKLAFLQYNADVEKCLLRAAEDSQKL